MVWKRVRRRVAVGAYLMVVSSLAGCMMWSPADRERGREGPQRLNDNAWPERDVALAQALVSPVRRDFPKYEVVDQSKVGTSGSAELLTMRQHPYRFEAVVGRGVLRLSEDAAEPELAAAVAGIDRLVYGFLQNGEFISSYALTSEDAQKRRASKERDLSVQDTPLIEKGLRHSREALNAGRGLGVSVGVPADRELAKARGLVLYLPPMFGNKYVDAVIDALRARGFAVLGVESDTTIFQNWTFGRTATGFSAEKVPHPALSVRSGGDRDVLAQVVAGRVDQGLAERAYTAEALVDYVTSKHPHLAEAPIAVVGFSAGSIATPAVAVRLGERVKAVVMVSGAANVPKAALRSNITDGGLEIDWGPGMGGADDLRAFYDTYLGASRLDPYHTAPLLSRTPTLLMLARFDRGVPVECGEVLAHRLGGPALAWCFGGHMTLFWMLDTQAERIADWVESEVWPVERPAREPGGGVGRSPHGRTGNS